MWWRISESLRKLIPFSQIDFFVGVQLQCQTSMHCIRYRRVFSELGIARRSVPSVSFFFTLSNVFFVALGST